MSARAADGSNLHPGTPDPPHPEDDPEIAGLYSVGTAVRVLHIKKMEDDEAHYVVIAQGSHRVRLLEGTQRDPFLMARVEVLFDVVPQKEDAEYAALMQSIRDLLSEVTCGRRSRSASCGASTT